MPSASTYYNLALYNSTTDATQTFLDYRLAQSGDALTSNMNILDGALHQHDLSISALGNVRGLIRVSLLKSTSNHYTATGVSALTTYTNSQLLVNLDFDYAGDGGANPMSININSLGAVEVVRQDETDVMPGELFAEKNYILYFDGTKYRLASPTFYSDLSYENANESMMIGKVLDNVAAHYQDCVSLGYGATPGSDVNIGNVAIGHNALSSVGMTTNDDYNVVIGWNSGDSGRIAKSVLVGADIDLGVSSTSDVRVGYQAATGVAGSWNVIAGYQAASPTANSILNKSVILGYTAAANAGSSLYSTENAVVIGYEAGEGATRLNGSVVIGYQAGKTNATQNELWISNSNTATPLIYGVFSGATAGITIYSQDDAGVPLRVKGTASQTGNLFEWQTNTGTPLLVQADGDLEFDDATDIVFDTTTGTKIGTATSQKLSVWNATPIVQPTTGVAEAAFTENAGGTAVNVDSTFGGYTIQQVVQALQNIGLLA